MLGGGGVATDGRARSIEREALLARGSAPVDSAGADGRSGPVALPGAASATRGPPAGPLNPDTNQKAKTVQERFTSF